jgi:hypothetical protein
MACALTQGYSLDCRDSAGGIKSVYFIEIDNVSGVTHSAGVVTAIAKANNKRFWKYNLKRSTGEATEEFQDSSENGTSFHRQTLSMVLHKQQASLRNEIALLAQNRLLAVVEDNNSKYWLYGKANGLERQGGSAKTGKAMGDLNGYELTFSGDEKDAALEVQSAVVSTLESI